MKIYGASKLKHWPFWLWLRHNPSWTNYQFIASWPDLAAINTDDAGAMWFWPQDIKEVRESDVVMVYAEADDILRGALIEAGAAIALNKPVLVVGPDNSSFGTWQYHPLVTRTPDITSALYIVNSWRR